MPSTSHPLHNTPRNQEESNAPSGHDDKSSSESEEEESKESEDNDDSDDGDEESQTEEPKDIQETQDEDLKDIDELVADMAPIYEGAPVPGPEKDIDIQDVRNVFTAPTADDSQITQAVHRQLVKQYLREKITWSPDACAEVHQKVYQFDYSICDTTGKFARHSIQKKMAKTPTWTGFFFLRVMFGPRACANQAWFPTILEKYAEAMNDAPQGIIPKNYREILKDPGWDWQLEEPGMKNPTMMQEFPNNVELWKKEETKLKQGTKATRQRRLPIYSSYLAQHL